MSSNRDYEETDHPTSLHPFESTTIGFRMQSEPMVDVNTFLSLLNAQSAQETRKGGEDGGSGSGTGGEGSGSRDSSKSSPHDSSHSQPRATGRLLTPGQNAFSGTGKSMLDPQLHPIPTESFEDVNQAMARKKASKILETEKRQIFFYQPKYLHPESLQVIAQNLLDEWERELFGLQEEERRRIEAQSEGQPLGDSRS